MAEFEVRSVDELAKQLQSLGDGVDEITDKMLIAGGHVLKREMQSRAQAHWNSGDMTKSIRETKPKRHSDGVAFVVVRPTGKTKKTWGGRKNKKGTRPGDVTVRNMDKMMYLEYGTSKQAATPIVQPAIHASEKEVEVEMQRVFDQEAGRLTR